MKFFAKFLMIALITATFAACNTISGAGKDIKAGGAAIENSADEAKK